jgi:hypothetical protein
VSLIPSVLSQGDQVAVVNTEHSLVTDTTPGAYRLVVDLSVLQAGDTVQLRLKTKARSTGTGSTARTSLYATYTGVQTDPVDVILGDLVTDLYVEATLKQTAGVARTFPWKVLRL